MDPDEANPHQQHDQDDGPFHRISPARVATGLSNGIRRTITFITEPLSPARSEWEIESAPSTPGLEKFRRWSTIRKSTDASNLSATRPATPEEPRNFMTLPAEIQIVILQHLDFGDIERLRRTCKYWYNFATPRLVRSIVSSFLDTILTLFRTRISQPLPITPQISGKLFPRCFDS